MSEKSVHVTVAEKVWHRTSSIIGNAHTVTGFRSQGIVQYPAFKSDLLGLTDTLTASFGVCNESQLMKCELKGV